MKTPKIKSKYCQLLIVLVLVVSFNVQTATQAVSPSLNVNSTANVAAEEQDWLQEKLGDGLTERETIASQVVAEEFTNQISNVEWLAPLAPIAISPFFGITLLSGLACFGPEWLPDNALLSEGSPLANQNLFWAFLILTVLTSAPRFSKVSKPIAQMADFLETYSAIVILLVLKVMSMETFQSTEPESVALAIGHHAGILSMGWEGLMMIAMVINIIVVNSVKFFFEILVWITPIPFLDACFEAANKTLCAGLVAIYAFNPLIALAINIILFICCALAFTWIRRREIFYRTVLVDWVFGLLRKSKPIVPEHLTVFPKRSIGSIPARAKCKLERSGDGWKLTHLRLLRAHAVESFDGPANLDPGWWTTTLVLPDDNRLTFSSKYNDQIAEVADRFGIQVSQHGKIDSQSDRQVEFA